jgi:hypothetical protein
MAGGEARPEGARTSTSSPSQDEVGEAGFYPSWIMIRNSLATPFPATFTSLCYSGDDEHYDQSQ